MIQKEFGKKITHLSDLLIATQDEWSETVGISSKDYNLFLTIQENPGCTQLFLAKKRHVERSLLTRLIKKYTTLGLIERYQSKSNKSAYALYLTENGEAMAVGIRKRILGLDHQMAQLYTETQFEQLNQLLDIAIKGLGGNHA